MRGGLGEQGESGRAAGRGAWTRLLRVLLATLGVALLVFVVALLLVNTDVVGERLENAVLPQLSAQLGRQVTVGELRVSVLPRPTVRVDGLRIAGVDRGPPLLEARGAVFALRLWPLVRSLGREIRVRSLLLEGPHLNLVRAADGSWNFEGLAAGPSEREVAIDQLRVENGVLRMVDRSGRDEEAAIALTRISVNARGLTPGGSLQASLRAAFASGRENLALSLTRRGPKGLTGTVEASDLPVDAARALMPAGLGAVLRGGVLSLRAKIAPEADGALAARGSVSVAGLALRGSTARAGLGFLVARGAAGVGWRAEIDGLELEGPAVSLRGSGQLQTDPLRGRLDLNGSRLSLDALLARQPAAEQEGGPLPAPMRRQLEQAELEATLSISRVSSGAFYVNDLQAEARLRSSVLEVLRASAGLYGGKAELENAAVLLWQPVPDWKFEGRLDGVDLGRALREVAGESPVSGKLGGSLALRGTGNDWPRLAESLRGEARLTLREGEWSTLDLTEALGGALNEALSRLGMGGSGFESKQGTALPAVDLAFALREGWMRMLEPIEFGDGWGRTRLSGAVGLDARVDLVGELFVAPEYLARLSGGRLRPRGGLELPVTILGTLAEPKVQIAPPSLAPSLFDRLPGR